MATVAYIKRFRMERTVPSAALPVPALPPGYVWLAWHDVWLETHAEVKYLSFRGEIDARVFPSLADRDGCRQVMRAITQRPTFCPAATWLVATPDGFCGTIQGICEPRGVGSIQNLGVLPEYRGQGIGSALLCQAIEGFRRCGMRRVRLEVTAENHRAIALYRRFGFRLYKTLYRDRPLVDLESRSHHCVDPFSS